MRIHRLLTAYACFAIAHAWQCDSIQLGKAQYDLSALDSEHTIELTTKTPPTVRHTIYTLNPCSPIKKDKEVSAEDQCPAGTLVCKVTSIEKDSKQTVIEVLAYASDEKDTAEVTELSPKDKESDGFEVTFAGEASSDGAKVSTSIDFFCDKDVSIGKPKFQEISSAGVAKFSWYTKHACSKGTDDGPKQPDPDVGGPPRKSTSWGFFTWLFLIVFMAIASFLIFTLFLNYNRYGQVGLDMVPAMDSVKDIPYLFKDFASQVVETVKGSGGTRSGYSAV